MIKLKNFDRVDRQMVRLARSLDPEIVEPLTESSAEVVRSALHTEVNRLRKVTGRLSESAVVRQLQKPVNAGGARPNIAAINRSAKKGGAPHAWLVNRSTGFFTRAIFLSRSAARDALHKGLKEAVLKEVR